MFLLVLSLVHSTHSHQLFTAAHEVRTTAQASSPSTPVTKLLLSNVVQKIDIESFQPFNAKAFDAILQDEEYKVSLQIELNGLLSPYVL